jgi:hypothetical protein
MITPTDPSRVFPGGLFAAAAHNGIDAHGEQDGNWQSAHRNSAFSAHSGRVRSGSRQLASERPETTQATWCFSDAGRGRRVPGAFT